MHIWTIVNLIVSLTLNLLINGQDISPDFDSIPHETLTVKKGTYSGVRLDGFLPDSGSWLIKLKAKDGYFCFVPPKLIGTGEILIADSLNHRPFEGKEAPFVVVLKGKAAKHRFLAIRGLDSVIVQPITVRCPKVLKTADFDVWLKFVADVPDEDAIIFSTVDSLQWIFPSKILKTWELVPDSGLTGKFVRFTAKDSFEGLNINDPIWMLHDTVALLLCPSAELVIGDSLELSDFADEISELGPGAQCQNEVKKALKGVYLIFGEGKCHFVRPESNQQFDVIHVGP